jgi:serine O-acetyltransferase
MAADGAEIARGEQCLVGADLIRSMGLWAILREDMRTHRNETSRPGLHTLWNYRIGVWGKTLPQPFRLAVGALYFLGHRFCRNFYGIELHRTARIGRRLLIAHQNGIVIHQYATIGDDCIVRQGVTFGIGTEWIRGQGPVIGSNVSFAPGAMVIGNVTIGDNVSVGPNCVISADVPADRALFLPPPRVLPRDTGQR